MEGVEQSGHDKPVAADAHENAQTHQDKQPGKDGRVHVRSRIVGLGYHQSAHVADDFARQFHAMHEDHDPQSQTRTHYQFAADKNQIIQQVAGLRRSRVPLRGHNQNGQGQSQQRAHAHRRVGGSVNRRGHRQPAHPGQHQGKHDELVEVELVYPIHEENDEY